MDLPAADSQKMDCFPEIVWKTVPPAWKQSVLPQLPDSFPEQSAPAFSQRDMPNLPHLGQCSPHWTRSVPQRCLPGRWRILAACWQKALPLVLKLSFPWISATGLSGQSWEPVLLFLHICVFHFPIWFESLSKTSLHKKQDPKAGPCCGIFSLNPFPAMPRPAWWS